MMFVTNPSSDFIILALYLMKGFESDFAPCLASLSTILTILFSTCSFFFWIFQFSSSAQVSVCAISLCYRRSFFLQVLLKALYLLFLFLPLSLLFLVLSSQ